MVDEKNGWRTTQDEFRGYVKRALEDIKSTQDEIKDALIDHDERISNNENEVTKIKSVAGVVAGFFGIVGGTIVSWVLKLWQR